MLLALDAYAADHERTGSGSSAECGCHPDVRAPLQDGAALARILVK